MPLRSGAWTKGERIFAEEYARTGDRIYAAEKAGFRGAAQSASQLLQRPAIVRRISELRREKLPVLVDKAYGHLEATLDDEKASIRDKNTAAKIVLTEARAEDVDDEGKDLAEMTGQELNRAIAKAQARAAALEHAAAERARPILEGELVEAEDETEDNVFA